MLEISLLNWATSKPHNSCLYFVELPLIPAWELSIKFCIPLSCSAISEILSLLVKLKKLQRICQVYLIENTVLLEFSLISQCKFSTDCFSIILESIIPNSNVKKITLSILTNGSIFYFLIESQDSKLYTIFKYKRKEDVSSSEKIFFLFSMEFHLCFILLWRATWDEDINMIVGCNIVYHFLLQ